MTREECEAKILELMGQIRDVVLEYNPNEEYVDLCLNKDVETFPPLWWTNFCNAAVFQTSRDNKPFEFRGYIPRKGEESQKGETYEL